MNVCWPPAATVALVGEIVTGAVTVTVAVANAPFESLTFTVSATPAVLPAVYTPADVTAPPELLVGTDQVKLPLPPEAMNVWWPPAATVALVGEIVTGAVTGTVAAADSPSESITFTVSSTPPALPAVYTPANVIEPPELLVDTDQL